MEGEKKKRAGNWTAEEKEILRLFVSESRHILEDKSNKTSANLLKIKEWKNIASKFNEITVKNRMDVELKLAWKRMKLAAKANISTHRQQQMATGGGEKPMSPSQEDLAIMEIAPHDFLIQINNYDSDAVPVVVAESTLENSEVVAGPSTSIQFEEPVPEISYEVEFVPDEDNLRIPTKREFKKEGGICKKKKVPQNIKEVMQQRIVEGNVELKKRQLDMLEVEHEYNVRIAKLKIKKLELEISLLETEKKAKTNNN